MEPEAIRKDSIAVLHEEMDALLFANKLYREGSTSRQEPGDEYQRRQDRLEVIKRTLIQLDIPRSRDAPYTVREGVGACQC